MAGTSRITGNPVTSCPTRSCLHTPGFPSQPSATRRPRDFTRGIFKFRSTPGKDSLPSDADLFITVTHGLWGTAMPTWEEISGRERVAVIQYIKAFSERWQKEQVGQPIVILPETPV